jgi:hypothetical protein
MSVMNHVFVYFVYFVYFDPSSYEEYQHVESFTHLLAFFPNTPHATRTPALSCNTTTRPKFWCNAKPVTTFMLKISKIEKKR